MTGYTGCRVALALIGGSLLAGCGTGEAQPSEEAAEAAPLPVETAEAYRADIFATLHATATLEADAEAGVPARVGGTVVELLAEEGDQVRQGQILARLDGERLALELRQAGAKLEMTTRALARFGRLRERGLVSAAAVESLEFERDALAASFDLMRLQHEYTRIRAPIDGVVSAREIKVGTQVVPGAPLFRITGTSQLVVHLLIPQLDLSRVSPGDRATVTVDALPGRHFDATVARISPTIDTKNGTFTATATIDNGDGSLAPGMFGRFAIAYERHAAAVLIPSDAVVREDNASVVYVVAEGAASRRQVELGIETAGQVEILAGVSESERVVVTGHGSLRDGSRVLARSNDRSRTAG